MAPNINQKNNGDSTYTTEVPRIEGNVEGLDLNFGLSPLGTPGLKQTGGQVYEEFLLALQGARGVRLYAEMEKNSATIGAIRMLVRDLARQVEWTVLPNDKSKDPRCAKKWAELVDGMRNDMDHSWADLISEGLSMIEYGFAPMEVTYKLRRGRGQPPEFDSKYKDGHIGWRSIEMRAQDTLDRWEYDRNTRRLRGMWQADYYSGFRQRVFIPMERLVLFRTESTKNNPEGRSLFRNAVDAYLKLKHVQTVEMIGVERDLTGLPVMEVPLAILKANQTDPVSLQIKHELEKQLGSLKRHEREFLIMPTSEFGQSGQTTKTGYAFRLEKSPGARQLDVVAIKNSYKTDIFQSCLAQFLQLGQNTSGGGSRALSSDQTDLFSLTMYSLLESIREVFQRQAIDRLCNLNGVDEDDIPQLSFGDIENPNLGAIGAYLTALNNTGQLMQTEELSKHLYKIAGLPYVAPAEVRDADELADMALNGDDLSGIKDAGKDAPVELLNAAQLTSLMQVVEAMASGTLPKQSAATILITSLGMAYGVVEDILAPVEEQLNAKGPVAPSVVPPGGAPPQPGVTPPQLRNADQLIDDVMSDNKPEDVPTFKSVGDEHAVERVINEVFRSAVAKGIAKLTDVVALQIARAKVSSGL